ncbi:ribonuclease Z [Microvirga thermotolerans]|uniref:Ribonuclease Z n=1 Tax=Microvirga thermotolerans TaxID=2651334 RepID=A0A5P9JV82_9HYPH|nr:MBL fold metallo-hydrolase [Microvirga thermotolerans]QFU16517.1 ribonuclease Z [Microvirga thermotolerans]
MSWLIQPRLVNGPFDDPGLYLDFRFGRRALLFDLGDLGALSARELLRVSHAFVSHAHVDHFIGFDRLMRFCLHRPGPLHLVGPPGFIDHVEHKLRGYTWNLIDESSVDFQLHVGEFNGLRLDRFAVFSAQHVFERWEGRPPELPPGVVFADGDFRVEAAALDHGIPSLAFALRETRRVNVRRGVLDRLGLPKGTWLNETKRLLRAGIEDADIEIPGTGRASLRELKDEVFLIGPGQSLAYVTDTAPTPGNAERIVALAADVDRLFIEAVFPERDRALAEAALHLTAWEAGRLARKAGAKRLTVFHHSARYIGTPDALRLEAMRAFEGCPEPETAP